MLHCISAKIGSRGSLRHERHDFGVPTPNPSRCSETDVYIAFPNENDHKMTLHFAFDVTRRID